MFSAASLRSQLPGWDPLFKRTDLDANQMYLLSVTIRMQCRLLGLTSFLHATCKAGISNPQATCAARDVFWGIFKSLD